ncbi:hypothetical protein BGY98DRAFT_1048952, partial [Russula aff. rugulosa BPL654]
MPACVPLSQHRQSSKLRGLHVELPRDPSFKNAHTFLSFSNLAHVPLQTFLDFNAAYIL